MSAGLSACLETLFTETEDFAGRIAPAAEAGCNAVEMWFPRDRDPAAIRDALSRSETTLRLMLAGPVVPITDASNRGKFLDHLRDSIASAKAFGTETLIVQSGQTIQGRERAEQTRSVREALTDAADIAASSGVTLLYEPLNTRIDHPGYFADNTAEAIAVVREVGSLALGLLADIYHMSVMGEDIRAALEGHLDIVSHVHIADTHGRHEPGTGEVDYAGIFRWLRDEGYDGSFGLEYFPTRSSAETVAVVRDLLWEAGFEV